LKKHLLISTQILKLHYRKRPGITNALGCILTSSTETGDKSL
jgi:hypothetical protein